MGWFIYFQNYKRSIYVLRWRFHPKTQWNLPKDQILTQINQNRRFVILKITSISRREASEVFIGPQNFVGKKIRRLKEINVKKVQVNYAVWQNASAMFQEKSPAGRRTIQFHSRTNIKARQIIIHPRLKVRQIRFLNQG